jgi:hypothetical protein
MAEMNVSDLLEQARQRHRAGKIEEAISFYRQALEREPGHADAMHLLGLAVLHAGRYGEAIEIMSRAMGLDSSRAEYHFNLAGALAEAGRHSEAAGEFGEAVRIRPDYANAAFNLGRQLRHLGYLEEAADALRLADMLRPGLPAVHTELGLVLMQSGDLLEGWREYEWRWKELKPLFPNPEFSRTMWDGSDPAGKRVLIYGEGGYGDALHFVRYASVIKRRGGRVFLLCHPEMYRLFQTVRDVEEVVPVNQQWPKFDVHCPLLSLPRACATTLKTIPADVPYLSADPQLSLRWRRRVRAVEAGGKNFHVGLVWSGDPAHSSNAGRCVELRELAPLGAAAARFYSLQKGSPGAEARQPGAGMEIIDWTGELNDWADTAALVANLDLVISIDTSVAHLAGAMGKRVWLLLPRAAEWRWMMDREDSPWYPTMRLFRCKADDDWDEPIRKMAEALIDLAGKSQPAVVA